MLYRLPEPYCQQLRSWPIRTQGPQRVTLLLTGNRVIRGITVFNSSMFHYAGDLETQDIVGVLRS